MPASRAAGPGASPSPDSDYDVRFIYCHPAAWYLTLDEAPDTLNFPVDEELDLAGWELRKALRLRRGSNAALFEWLQSPVVYHEALDFRVRLAEDDQSFFLNIVLLRQPLTGHAQGAHLRVADYLQAAYFGHRLVLLPAVAQLGAIGLVFNQ